MHRLIWHETDQEEQELVAMCAPLREWDLLRMLEPVFARFGPKLIISTCPEAKIANAHFLVEWHVGPRPEVVLCAAIFRVEEAGWLSVGKRTKLGDAWIIAEPHCEPQSDVSLCASTLGRVSQKEVHDARIDGLYEKLTVIESRLDRLCTLQEKMPPVPAIPTQQEPPHTQSTPRKIRKMCSLPDVTLVEELSNFNIKSLKSATVEPYWWLNEERLAQRTEGNHTLTKKRRSHRTSKKVDECPDIY